MSNTNGLKKKKGMSLLMMMSVTIGGIVAFIIVAVIVAKMMTKPKHNKVILNQPQPQEMQPAPAPKSFLPAAPKEPENPVDASRVAVLEAKFAAMDKGDRDIANAMYSQAKRIDALEITVQALTGRISTLTAAADAEALRVAEAKANKAKKSARTSEGQKGHLMDTRRNTLGYKVSAVVNKRAWVDPVEGDEVSVTVGDELPVKSVQVKRVNGVDKTVTVGNPQ